MIIGYLGPEGSYTEEITRQTFPRALLIPFNPIRKGIMAVENGEVDKGVVPLENCYGGEVEETLDSFVDCDKVRITGETFLRIEHYLGALHNHGKIRKIISHSQALRQCSRYLCKRYPTAELVSVGSTSEAVAKIKNEGLTDAAAIASREIFGNLEILASSWELCPNNRTRFAILSREKVRLADQEKTFLIVRLRDEPGVLYCFLKPFADYKINLEFLWSRPDMEKGYYFFVELGSYKSRGEKIVKAMALNELSEKDFGIRLFGSYKDSRWKNED